MFNGKNKLTFPTDISKVGSVNPIGPYTYTPDNEAVYC